MRKAISVTVIVIASLILFLGCATAVPVTVTKPAEVNMSSMRRIAVLDFNVTHDRYELSVEKIFEAAMEELFDLSVGGRAIEREIEEYTTERFIIGLVQTNYFQVVGAPEIKRAIDPTSISMGSVQAIGEKLDAQGILTGEIYRISAEDEKFTRTENVTDPETDAVYETEIRWIRRTAVLGLTYHVFNTESGALFASRSFEASIQDEQETENKELLREPVDMYREIVDSFIPKMMKQLAPYTVRESRRLMKDKRDDPIMESARQHAKNGMYDRALELYIEVWNDSRNPAAGFNGAIMYEVTGDIDAAVSLMKEVVDRYPEKKIFREYNRLLGVREEQERLAEQLS
jgi:hypothetical protein